LCTGSVERNVLYRRIRKDERKGNSFNAFATPR